MDKLVDLGADVTVLDNLSSGKLENLQNVSREIKFFKYDLEYGQKKELKSIFNDMEIVFHLAAVHGGRGYITSHPADVCSNLSIDHHVFEVSVEANVRKVVFASTACVYPTRLQKDIGSDYRLTESDSDPFNLENYLSADIEYGWSKLMAEIQMISFNKQYGLKGCPVRFVTAYGPRENETHAIIALIYKAVEKMDPYEIWGDGKQERDFTYVQDIVSGTILAAERIDDCTPINLGTGKRYSIQEVVDLIFAILNWKPKSIEHNSAKPVGALSRALDNQRAKEMLGWEPRYDLREGLLETINWYTKARQIRGKVSEKILLEH